MKNLKNTFKLLVLCGIFYPTFTFPLWPQTTPPPAPNCIPCPIEVSGQVINPAGDPAYATKVSLSNESHTLLTLTDAAGNYRIATNICLSGNYTLSIYAVGYTPQSVVCPLSCGSTLTNSFTLIVPTPTPIPALIPTLQPTASPACTTYCNGLIEGYIYDQAGTIRTGVNVSFTDNRSTRTTVTATDGYYSFVTYWCPIRRHQLWIKDSGKQTHSIVLYPNTCNTTRYDIYLAPANKTSIKGDVNDDGIINIVDALMIAQYAVGLGGINVTTADTNCDGRITIVDALIVAQYYVGMIFSLPC